MTAWFLTWLWQGTVLALVVSTAFRHLPQVNAATRYLIWWGAFFALIWLGWSSSPHSVSPAAMTPALEPASNSTFALHVPPLPLWSVTLIISLWASVALFKLLRILSGLHGLYRLKDACTPMLRSIEEQLPLWQAAKRQGRPVQLMFCRELSSAAVLGLHRPCIAFPQRLLEVVSADELDQIALHEYGHVQRRDDWMRLGQALLEAAVWIHPATQWVCRELNLEREVACDDWVVSRTGAPQAYADCLSRVAENRQCPVTPVFTPALFGGKRALFRRVDRLLDTRRNAKRELSLMAACAGLCFLGTAAVHVSAYSVIVERVAPSMPVLTVSAAPVGPAESAGPKPGPASSPKPGPTSPKPGPTSLKPGSTSDVGLAFPPSRSFGEVSPEFAEHGRATADRPAQSAGLKPGPTSPKPGPTYVATMEPAEDAVPLVEGRSFNGVHSPVAILGGSPAREAVKGWELAGTAGANIAKVTSKAGVGIANAFSRAGVSLARSF